MAKAIINFGYRKLVVDAEEAMVIARAISNAEQYETRGYGDDAACYIWPRKVTDAFEVSFISDEQYRLAKLAGEPPARS